MTGSFPPQRGILSARAGRMCGLPLAECAQRSFAAKSIKNRPLAALPSLGVHKGRRRSGALPPTRFCDFSVLRSFAARAAKPKLPYAYSAFPAVCCYLLFILFPRVRHHTWPSARASASKFSRFSSMTSGRFMTRAFMLMTYSPKKPRNTSCTPPIKKTAIIIGA